MGQSSERRRISKRTWLALLALPVIGAGLLLGGHGGLLGLADHVGYAVCHQIMVRTYVFGDLVMPLCARCSGQYLGLAPGVFLAWRWGRLRASGLPPLPILLALLGFLGVWAFDGVNSYLLLVLGHPWLYPPANILRVSTGMLQGLAVAFFFLPFFNQVFWVQPDPSRVIVRWAELAQAVGLGAVVVVAVQSQWLPLFYPLALLSSFSSFFMLSMVGALLALILLRQENANRTGRDFLTILPPGMAFAVLLLLFINLTRFFAENNLGFTLPVG